MRIECCGSYRFEQGETNTREEKIEKCGAAWLVLFASVSRLIRSWWMRWASHVAYMWEKRHACRVFGGESEGRRPPGSKGLCGRVILKRILKKLDGRTYRLD